MKKAMLSLILIPLIFTYFGCSKQMKSNISIIPKPAKVKINKGVFTVTPETKILLHGTDEAIEDVGTYLINMLNRAGGFEFTAETYPGEQSPGTNTILLKLSNKNELLGVVTPMIFVPVKR